MTHCGIYVGNHMMLHCGDPISYTNLNNPYWQDHFFQFGRLLAALIRASAPAAADHPQDRKEGGDNADT